MPNILTFPSRATGGWYGSVCHFPNKANEGASESRLSFLFSKYEATILNGVSPLFTDRACKKVPYSLKYKYSLEQQFINNNAKFFRNTQELSEMMVVVHKK